MRYLCPLLLLACVRASYAKADLAPTDSLTGPKVLTVVATDEDFSGVEASLRDGGFAVERSIAGVTAPPQTRYVARVEGVCGMSGVADATFRLEVFESSRRLFVATATMPQGCPEPFLTEAVGELNRVWGLPPYGGAP